MTDSRVKIDLMFYQMVDFKEEFVLMQGEPPVEFDLKTATLTMQVRKRAGDMAVLAMFDSALSADPAYEAGKPLKGRVLLPAADAVDNLGHYVLSMQEAHTAHLCPEGKEVLGTYDIILTKGGASSVIQYGDVKFVPSPSRADVLVP